MVIGPRLLSLSETAITHLPGYHLPETILHACVPRGRNSLPNQQPHELSCRYVAWQQTPQSPRAQPSPPPPVELSRSPKRHTQAPSHAALKEAQRAGHPGS